MQKNYFEIERVPIEKWDENRKKYESNGHKLVKEEQNVRIWENWEGPGEWYIEIRTWQQKCNCEKQIVWHYEKPVVLVCENCQITLYSTKPERTHCPICGEKITLFFKEDKFT